MIDQQLQWIALPNGPTPDGAGLRLSVFVAPRLRTDEGAVLAPFLDFLDWPERVIAPGTTFAIEMADGTSLPATVVSEAPDSTLWKALFGPNTVLDPFKFDRYADRPLISFSVDRVLGTLKDIYARVAGASPDELPKMVPEPHQEPPEPGLLEPLEGIIGARTAWPLGEGVDDGKKLDDRIDQLLAQARGVAAQRAAQGGPPSLEPNEPLPATAAISRHFQRVLLFHRRPGDPVEMPGEQVPADDFYAARIDFHQMISALGDHPYLLRRLGLVVDLTFARGALPMADDLGPVFLRVRPTWESQIAPGRSTDLLPLTACVHQEVDGELFFGAADRIPNSAAPHQAPPTGLLALPATAFSVEQLDVDGAALKALNLAANVNQVAKRLPADTPLEEPDTAGLPALRTGGLALVHKNRAKAVQGEFARTATLNDGLGAPAPAPLFAEDVARGYRLDVFESARNAWRSLHQRSITYSVPAPAEPLPPVDDEGFFQLSLAGKAVPPAQPPDPNGELYLHETIVTWDGWSLAAARPGKSLSRDPRAPTEEDPATQPQRVTNDPLTTLGLSIETSVRPGTLPRLRFASAYRFRVRIVDLAGNGPTLDEADRRLAAASTDTPALPVDGETQYLRFEPVAAPAIVPRAPYGEGSSVLRLVVRSDAGTSAEDYAATFNGSDLVVSGAHPGYAPKDDRHVVPPKTALEMVERHGRLDSVIGSDGTPPDEARRAAMTEAYEVARREKGALAEVDPSEQLDLPYLPDPLARGAVFFGLPGQPAGEPFTVTFDGPSWFRVAPFRFELREGSGPPRWDPERRVLAVSLAQATTASVRVCSLFGGEIRETAIVRWCEEMLVPPQLDAVHRAASENRCWMLTPWRDIELVHAVQRPLQPPQLAEFAVSRDIRATVAHVFGVVILHAASTEKVDLTAEWTEEVDDLEAAGPEVRSASQVVFALPLKVAAKHGRPDDPRDVPYSLSDDLVTFNSRPREDASTLPVTAHPFGDTKHRHVRYHLGATTPFREYFPQAWATQPARLSRPSDVVEVDVLSSAPPAPPRVLYVVPTQEWEAEEQDGATVQRRLGGGLRVYLDRPWFSSGNGELLGVVVGGAVTTPAAHDHQLVTLLGQDPLRAAHPLEFARTERFRDVVVVATRVRLLELGGPTDLYSVVAYKPTYDAGTKRWFCDISLDTEDAYFPFVRLCLVRYQPRSEPGCHVSQVARCDIVQTLPDRTLTVRRDPVDANVLDINVTGPSYAAIGALPGARSDPDALGRIVVTLEELDPTFADEALGWRPVDGVEAELVAAPEGRHVRWSGRLTVTPSGDDRRRRMALVEFDHLAGDEQTAGDLGVVPRIAYADVVPV